MVQVFIAALNLLVVTALIGCAIGWGFGVGRLLRGQPLVEPESRLRPLHGFAEAIMAIGLWLVLTVAAFAVAERIGWLQPVTPETAGSIALRPDFAVRVTIEGTAKLVAIGLLLTWLQVLDRHSWRRLGLVPHLSDFRTGVVAATMLIPPIMMIQQLLNLLTPYEHPVKDLIEARPTAVMGTLLAMNTVIIAPLAEEFFFRGLLQGWFERVGRRREVERTVAVDVPPGDVEQMDEEPVGVAHGAVGSSAGDGEGQPGELPQGDDEATRQWEPLPRGDWIRAEEVAQWPWWPMVLTSLLFALVHWGQGAAPVSLFLLAMGLSYLTRQTGRLWPAITVHFCLNACATAAMFLAAESPVEPPPLGP